MNFPTSQTPPPPDPNFVPAQPAVSEPVGPGLSEGQRLINVFFAPSKTFADIRRNASWWVPFVLVCVFAVTFFVTIDKKVGFEQIARTMMENNSQFQQQPPEQQERTLGFVTTSIKISGYASPILILIYALVIAAVLMGTFNFGMAAEVSFGQAMAITFYSWLPSVLGSIIALITLLLGNPEGFNLQNPVGTNIAYYMDASTTPKFLYSFLTAFDVINFWIIGLIGMGFAITSKKKLSISTAIMTVAVWYFLAKLVGAGFASLRG
jgi:hypothetical protein